MWIKYRNVLLNLDNLCGITKHRSNSVSAIEQGQHYRVEIYSSGKCFHLYEFGCEEARDLCYNQLVDKVLSHNYNNLILGEDDDKS